MPKFSDADGDIATISIAEASGGGILPSCIQLKSGNTLIEAAPVAFTDVGAYSVKIVLTTIHEVVSFPFPIIVTNTAPYFKSAPPTDITFPYSTSYTVNLTDTYKDNENHAITLTYYFTPSSGGIKTLIPSGIFTLASPTEIKIAPKSSSDMGDYLLEYLISDGQPLSTTAKTYVSIVNNYPKLKLFKPKFN